MVQKEESLSKKHEMKVMSFISIKLSIDLMLLTMRKKYFLLGKNVTKRRSIQINDWQSFLCPLFKLSACDFDQISNGHFNKKKFIV